jgi:hypothetical protein
VTGNCNAGGAKPLLVGDVNLAVVDGLGDNTRGLAINLATHTVGSAQNLLDNTLEVLGERLEAHGPGNLDDLVHADRLVVLDVLLLLAVTRGLLERLDDQRRGSGDNRDLRLSVLDGELDSYAQAFPVASGLGDILADLLGGETQRTNLRGQRRGCTDFTTSGAKVAMACQFESVAVSVCVGYSYITLISLGSNLGGILAV